MTITEIKVNGMTCGHCTGAVEETLGELAGVETVVADLESGIATITHDDDVDVEYMRGLIQEIGFELG